MWLTFLLDGGRYNENPHYFGGIVAFTRAQFLKVNGFPNTFWGYVSVLLWSLPLITDIDQKPDCLATLMDTNE